MAKHGVDPARLDAWFAPLRHQSAVREDAARFLRAVDRHVLIDAADRLPDFDRPTLIVWAAEDRVMPQEHAERLAALLPNARIVLVPDSYTLVPLDQPGRLAALTRQFVRTATVPG